MQNKKKLTLALTLVFLVNILVVLCFQSVDAAIYKKSSPDSAISTVQTRLIELGFSAVEVNGVYDEATAEAVKTFQRQNGLFADGVCRAATKKALGLSVSRSDSGANDELLLARLIYSEAGDEPYTGQVAVGAVVLNRMKHPSFPSGMTAVVYQNGAFNCVSDGTLGESVSDSAMSAARDALNGADPSGGAKYYFNTWSESDELAASRDFLVKIGKYSFYA